LKPYAACFPVRFAENSARRTIDFSGFPFPFIRLSSAAPGFFLFFVGDFDFSLHPKGIRPVPLNPRCSLPILPIPLFVFF